MGLLDAFIVDRYTPMGDLEFLDMLVRVKSINLELKEFLNEDYAPCHELQRFETSVGLCDYVRGINKGIYADPAVAFKQTTRFQKRLFHELKKEGFYPHDKNWEVTSCTYAWHPNKDHERWEWLDAEIERLKLEHDKK